jgi:hypothetical protein
MEEVIRHWPEEEARMDGMKNFRERLAAVEAHMHAVEQRLRWWRGIACGLLIVGLISLPLPSGMAKEEPPGRAHREEHPDKDNKGLQQRVKTLEDKLKVLQDKLAAVIFDAATNEVVITGANLRIVNGLGSTETTNGLGNLIVGYNESRAREPVCDDGAPPPFSCTDTRTGSHNIVVGAELNFSSFGGLVVGKLNAIRGRFASVSGGSANTASGSAASISGGSANTANGEAASVSGGVFNSAAGDLSSVSGGEANWARGTFSSVTGGSSNTASGGHSSVSGGENNMASGNFSSVSGGRDRTTPDNDNWAAGSLLEPN